MRFDGHGYLKYFYETEEEKHNFQLSLRIKTSDAEGTVMMTNASDWGTLQVWQLTINSHHNKDTDVRNQNLLLDNYRWFVGDTGLLSIVFRFLLSPSCY